MTETTNCPQCGSFLPADAPEGICPRCLMLAGLQDINSPAVSPAFARTTPAGSPFVPATPEQIAAYFPQLHITGILGVGGMGTVYKARQTKLDRNVALKIIRPESAQDAAFAERFNREARTLAKLNHPNIVGVHDFGEVDVPGEADQPASKFYFFLMEYVDGPNLREVVQAGQLDANQALAIIPQICEALEFAHDEGVVHRDIKPENILVDTRGRVKIADFGLAKLAERSAESFTLTGTHQVMGTPRYMAPEQMEGSREVDRRADIFSLGVVFYELLTGELPMGQFEPPSVKAGVDARLDEVVLRALAREPERRYQTASELKRQVDAISSVNVSGLASKSFSSYPAGASTIIEREAMAAWRWLAADSAPVSASVRPQIPTMLMILMCIAGCAICFLPWMSFELLDVPGNVNSDQQSNVVDQLADLASVGPKQLMCMIQDASGIASTYSYIETTSYTFCGTDAISGRIVCGCFAFLLLVIIAIPQRKRGRPGWLAAMTLIAIAAVTATLTYQQEVTSRHLVRIPVASAGHQSAAIASTESDILVAYQQGVPSTDEDYWYGGARPLARMRHRMTYLPGFYGILGITIGMVLLCATGIRHSLAEEPQSAAIQNQPAGLPGAGLGVLAGATPKFEPAISPEGFATSVSSTEHTQPSAETFSAVATGSRSHSHTLHRFSGKAIIGACLFPLFMLPTFGILMVAPASRGLATPSLSYVGLLLTVISAMPLILTPLLGMMAISDIRNSRGRIRGLGLAFFDVAVFPTMISVGLLTGFVISCFADANQSAKGLGVPLSFLMVIFCTVVTLRLLWKKTTAGIESV